MAYTLHFSANFTSDFTVLKTDLKGLVRSEYSSRGRVVINSAVRYYDEDENPWVEVELKDIEGVGTISIPLF